MPFGDILTVTQLQDVSQSVFRRTARFEFQPDEPLISRSRDRSKYTRVIDLTRARLVTPRHVGYVKVRDLRDACLLYTSDAADE